MIPGKKWLDGKVPSLKGKRVFLTGGTSGIGLAASLELAYKGAAVTIACRSEKKAAEAKEHILENVPDADISFLFYDQSDPASIASLLDRCAGEKYDAIVFNAGLFRPRKGSAPAITFQTNAVGTYLLFRGLSASSPESRFVFVGSVANRHPPRTDYEPFLSGGPNDYFLRYGVSKRAVMNIYEKAYRESALDVTLISPGVARTEITRGYPAWFRWLANGFMSLFFHPAWKAGLGIVYLASGEGPRGSYSAPGDWLKINGYPKLYPAPHKKSAKGADELVALLERTYPR